MPGAKRLADFLRNDQVKADPRTLYGRTNTSAEIPSPSCSLRIMTPAGDCQTLTVTSTSNLSGRQRVRNPAHWCRRRGGTLRCAGWWDCRGHAGSAAPGDAGSRNQEVLSALHFVHRGRADEIAAESRRPELPARLKIGRASWREEGGDAESPEH